ncbi:MAG: hypothetical protein WAW17_03975 [Rhodococcus sp. (in: high G+C Gram-positive bacteria)]|uniref:DUF7064 domain-containing protein n=1 Tax=Rhodococcus sp. TaxID=1831 RepID=UPI003BAE9583
MTNTEPALDERPIADPPDVPLWSENYLFQAYDATSGFGVWLHLGLPSFDTGLWHGITVVYLPGATHALIAKDFSVRQPSGVVDCGMLSATQTSEGWTVRFRGAAQRVAVADLDTASAVDGVCEPLDFELHFAGLSTELLDLRGPVSGQSWADAHWEAPCTARGEVKIGGETAMFSGAGVRDHSRGPRDLERMGPHRFLHGQFPDGRCFGVIHMESRDGVGAPMSHGYLVEDGRLEHAEVLSVSMGETSHRRLEVALRGPDGEHRISGEVVHDIAFTIDYPNEVLFGIRAGATHVIREGMARWSWDGRTGYGLAERSGLVAGTEAGA